MSIKSPQTLSCKKLYLSKTISPEEALEMSNEKECNLIDLRDIRELEKNGRELKILSIYQEEY